MKNEPLVAITGIDSGIGKSLCGVLAENGFAVAGSYLESNPFGENPRVHAFRMDARNEQDISGFARYIGELCAGGNHPLFGIVNNAGIALGGPVEETPLSVYREVFEVNYFALVSFVQKMLPLLREQRGRIFVVGSMAGRVALPFLAPYASSKYAVEGFCDSLRRETAQFGIRTVLFEPGGIATPIWSKAKEQDRSFISDRYRRSITLFEEKVIDSGIGGWPADLAARQMFRIMVKPHPLRRYVIDSKPLMEFLAGHLPAALVDRFTAGSFALRARKDLRRKRIAL
jgi:Short-chain alcohol dehydrogenase of unknown specificity